MTWEDLEQLHRKIDYLNTLNNSLPINCDDYEEKIKAEYFAASEQLFKKAHAQIHAHRVEIFKDALARYVAEQGVNT